MADAGATNERPAETQARPRGAETRAQRNSSARSGVVTKARYQTNVQRKQVLDTPFETWDALSMESFVRRLGSALAWVIGLPPKPTKPILMQRSTAATVKMLSRGNIHLQAGRYATRADIEARRRAVLGRAAGN